MIVQPDWWRNDLLKTARKLEARYRQKRWAPRSLQSFEKELFIGFFVIRKLFESKQVDKTLQGRHVSVTAYTINDAIKGALTKRDHLAIFDAGKGQRQPFTIFKLCHQFIHSFVFFPFIPVHTPTGVFFSSNDHLEKHQVYYMRLLDVLQIYWSVGKNTWYDLNFEQDERGVLVTLPES